MSFFVIFIITLIDAIGLAYFLKKGVGCTAAIVNLSLIVILYVSGLFLHLEIGMYVFFTLTLLFFIIASVTVIKKQDFDKVINIVKSPVFVIYAVFGLVVGTAFFNEFSHDFDEMSHWALVVKNMYQYSNFGNIGDTTTMFNRYVPGSGIFIYAFQFLNDEFVNGNCYAAFDILTVSLLLVPAEKFGTKKPVLFYVSLLAPIALVTALKCNIFFNLRVDGLVGVMGAYIYLVYFADRGKVNALTFVEISLGIFAVIIVKTVGIAVAAIALLLILIDVLIRGRKNLVAFCKRPLNWALLLLPVLAFVFAKLSWSLYCDYYKVRAGWDVSELTLPSLMEYLRSPNEFQSAVNHNFWHTFLIGKVKYDNSSLQQPLVLFLPIYILLFVLAMLKGKEKGMSIGLFVFTIITITLYCVANLMLYIFSFAYEESLRLASYSRYVNTIFTMMGLIWVAHLCEALLSDVKISYTKTVRLKLGLKISLSVLSVVIAIGCFFYFRVDTRKVTADYTEWMEAVSTLSDTDRVYYVSTSDQNVEEYLLVRYMATPTRCNGWREGGSYALGRGGFIYTGDPFVFDMSVEQLTDQLNNYDYFFINHLTDEFAAKYGGLFEGEIKEKVLYKVNRTDEGILLSIKAD